MTVQMKNNFIAYDGGLINTNQIVNIEHNASNTVAVIYLDVHHSNDVSNGISTPHSVRVSSEIGNEIIKLLMS